jgi:hypothetical protein
MFIKEKKNLFVIAATIVIFLSGTLISTGIANIYATTTRPSTTTSQGQSTQQSVNVQAATPNELGQKLGDQLNKIINTPGVQLAKIKISCSVSGPPITITCTITFGSTANPTSGNAGS